MKVPTSTAFRAPTSRTSIVSSSPSSWVICMPGRAAELAVGLLGEVAQHLVGGLGVGEQVVVDGGADDVHAASLDRPWLAGELPHVAASGRTRARTDPRPAVFRRYELPMEPAERREGAGPQVVDEVLQAAADGRPRRPRERLRTARAPSPRGPSRGPAGRPLVSKASSSSNSRPLCRSARSAPRRPAPRRPPGRVLIYGAGVRVHPAVQRDGDLAGTGAIGVRDVHPSVGGHPRRTPSETSAASDVSWRRGAQGSPETGTVKS